MDTVSLESDIPDPAYPAETLSFHCRVPKGSGVAFVGKHFPDLDIKVISNDESILADRMGKDAVVHFAMQRRPDLEGGILVSSSIVTSRVNPATRVSDEGRDAQAPESDQAGTGIHNP